MAKSIQKKARLEAGALWTELVKYHQKARAKKERWPGIEELCKLVQNKYPNLHSHSRYHIIVKFLGAIKTIHTLREKGDKEARYPTKEKKYYTVPYTNQACGVRGNWLILSHGRNGERLYVKIPKNLQFPADFRFIAANLHFNKIDLVFEMKKPKTSKLDSIVGIDLGINTLISATDGKKDLLISGREVKAINQYRNMKLAELQEKQSKLKKDGRRWKRLQRRKYKMLDKCRVKTKDILHKATRKVANEFPNSQVFIGKAFNKAAQKLNHKTAQQVSEACNGKIIQMLSYKMSKVEPPIEEHYSSQTCPVCGRRKKASRTYTCKSCKYTLPRDVIGAVNIRSIGAHGKIVNIKREELPSRLTFTHPIKYLGRRFQVVPVVTRQVASSVSST